MQFRVALDAQVSGCERLRGGEVGRPFSMLPPRVRPRERLLAAGRESLSDVELLALQLRSGTSGANSNDLAIDLLAEFGSLQRLGSATVEELMRVSGVGVVKAAAVVAGFELGRRLPRAGSEGMTLIRASDVAEMAQQSLAGLRRERVLLLVCDRRGQLLREVQLSEGTADRCLIDPRDVMNAVLRYDGSLFALAHNHPSGDSRPSQADNEITRAVASAARAVGVRFLGHVVVADDTWAEVELTPAGRTYG